MSEEKEIKSVEMDEVSMNAEIIVCGESTAFGLRLPVLAGRCLPNLDRLDHTRV